MFKNIFCLKDQDFIMVITNRMQFFDMSIFGWVFVMGFLFGVFSFIITVLIEAIIMKRWFSEKSFFRCNLYSLLANLISTFLGIPIAFLFANANPPMVYTNLGFFASLLLLFSSTFRFPPNQLIISNFGLWLVLAFIMTFITEFIFYLILYKTTNKLKVAGFVLISNVASYTFTILLSFVVPLI
jgi:hypothetical protein